MPRIFPIRDLKNTDEISRRCHDADEPIYVTQNGCGDRVIMSMRMFEEKMFMRDVYRGLAEAEADVVAGRTENAKEALRRIGERYNV